ncbi:uncharacterized protein BX663DRAFT_509701 [Cokeromyces recurvatus]|uniref:uncharacterized protein n=1 Tax=Cokeromyces recurvatus TaxID=90255 RepID=UPI00221EDC82|nr:uncharacterized protein BX663DRAFT_509701 [Cokeromyces recurvatus]KAI7902574.1 hypothetical protein BX663DRAFT_509701 [Cokeromyces recurvatus]
MPSAVFSTLFAFITLTPWLFLITGWLQIGYTPGKVMLDLFSGSTVRTVSIIAFLASLVSVEYLFYLYWTKLNLFQTLTFLSGLIILVFFTGQRALNSIQARRLGQTK